MQLETEYLTTAEALDALPRGVTVHTLRNWIARGVVDRRTGATVTLPALRLGGRILVRREDLDNFLARG